MRDNRKRNSNHTLYALLFFLIPQLWAIRATGQSSDNYLKVDVLHYEAWVEPDISTESVNGKVLVRFTIPESHDNKFKLDCGDLVIESVQSGGNIIPFERKNSTIIFSSASLGKQGIHELEILYHGSPKWGMSFFSKPEEVYTVFSTSRWLVCNDSPSDKATLTLNIKTNKDLKVVGVGSLTNKSATEDNKVLYTWKVLRPVPTYTFGFAAGQYNLAVEQSGNIQLQYFAGTYGEDDLKKIFRETGKIIGFLEERSGVPYPGTVYSQIETQGSASQEMTGFCVLRNGYGKQVLNNATEINLSAHELAHQWWGNQITCSDWSHFWLNEGFAVFMSSAFKEQRFGREAYLNDMEIYFNAYQKVVAAGKDKPLAFMNWSNPTAEDRTLVYYKGAYFLHLLREEVGDALFWAGIKQYSSLYFGKSVQTKNFQDVMENVCNRSLDPFFSKWINPK